MSHSTALIDVTHPFTHRKRGKKHIKHPKRKMRTTDQTEVLCCVSLPADVVFPAEEGRGKRGSASFTFMSAADHPSASSWPPSRGRSFLPFDLLPSSVFTAFSSGLLPPSGRRRLLSAPVLRRPFLPPGGRLYEELPN